MQNNNSYTQSYSMTPFIQIRSSGRGDLASSGRRLTPTEDSFKNFENVSPVTANQPLSNIVSNSSR
jgi:hypothetical protein